MTNQVIIQQMTEARNLAKFNVVAVLPVGSTRSAYISNDYFDKYKLILETARRLDNDVSPALGLQVPEGTVMLFNGENLRYWQHSDGREFTWKNDSGVLETVSEFWNNWKNREAGIGGSIETKRNWQAFKVKNTKVKRQQWKSKNSPTPINSQKKHFWKYDIE